ncbi:MAG: TraY domain-containing protein [Pelovirga sp.]
MGVTIMLGIRLSDETEQRLEALAKATGRTKSYYAREAIEVHLDTLEDIYLSERAIENLKSGNDRVLESDEFWRGLDN